MPRWVITVVLLFASNAFMTWAWYGHLGANKRHWPLVMAIGISWFIALPEYILQVPANRFGHFSHGGPFTAPQLKIIQEAITLVVFTIFAIVVLKERPRAQDGIAMALVMLAVVVSMWGRNGGPAPLTPSATPPESSAP